MAVRRVLVMGLFAFGIAMTGLFLFVESRAAEPIIPLSLFQNRIVTVSIIAMMLFAGPIGDFVHRHPTIKMLALAFLLLIGVTLIAEGLHQHIPKGYIYFAMAFSVMVEVLNMRLRKKAEKPVILHDPYHTEEAKAQT